MDVSKLRIGVMTSGGDSPGMNAALRAVVVGDLAAAGDSLAVLAPQALRLTMAQLDLERPGLRKTP